MADRGDSHDDDKPKTILNNDIDFTDICGDICEEDDRFKEEITELPLPALGSLIQARASSPSSDGQTIEHRGIPAGEGGSFAAGENFTKTRDGVHKEYDSEGSVDNKKFIQSEKGTKNHCAASNIQTSSYVPQAESALLLTKSPSSVSSSTTNCDSNTAQKSLHSEQLIAEGSYPTKMTVFAGSHYHPDRSDFAKHSEFHEPPKKHDQFPKKLAPPQRPTLHPPLQDSAQVGIGEMMSSGEFQGYRGVAYIIRQILSSQQLRHHARPLSQFVTDGISGEEFLEYRCTVQQRQTMTFLQMDQSTGLIIVVTEIIRRSDYGEHSHAIAIRIIPFAIQMRHGVQTMVTGMRGGKGEQHGGVIRQTFASPQLGSNSQLQHLAIISEDETQEYPGAVVASTTHSTEPRAEAFETASYLHTFEGSAETERPLSTNTQVRINLSEDGQRQLPGPFDGLPPSDSTTNDAFTANASSNSSSRTAVNGPSCPRCTADCQPAGQPSPTVDAVHCHPSIHRLNQSATRSRFHLQPAPQRSATFHPSVLNSAQVGNAEMMSWGEFQGYRDVAYIIWQILSSQQLRHHARPLSQFVTDGISGEEFLEYRCTVQQRQTMTFLQMDQSTGLIIVVTEIIRHSDYGEHSHAIAIQISAIQMRHRVQNMVTGTMRGGEGEQHGGVIRQTFASPQLGSNNQLHLAIISEDETQEYPGAVVASTTHSTEPRAEATMRGGEGEQYGGATRQTFPSPQLGSNSCLRHLATISDDDGTQEYPGAVGLDDQCVDMADDRDMAEGDPLIFPADGEPHEINAADFENVFLPDQAADAAQQIPVQNGGRQFLQGFVLELLALLTQRDGRDRRVCSVPECGRADSCLFLFNCHDTVCAECYQGTNPRCPYCRQRVGWFFRLLQEEQEEVPGGRGDATEAEELEDMELSEEEEEQENDTS